MPWVAQQARNLVIELGDPSPSKGLPTPPPGRRLHDSITLKDYANNVRAHA